MSLTWGGVRILRVDMCIPSRELTYPGNGILKMIFLFPRWDMLVPWRVFYHNLTTIFLGGVQKVSIWEKKTPPAIGPQAYTATHLFFWPLLVTQRTVAPKVATTSTKSTKDEMSGSSSWRTEAICDERTSTSISFMLTPSQWLFWGPIHYTPAKYRSIHPSIGGPKTNM